MEDIRYRLDVLTAAGVKVAEVSDFRWLTCQKTVNGLGSLTVGFDAGHGIRQLLEHRGQVELYRMDSLNGINWYREFVGLFLDTRHEQKGKVADFELTMSGLNKLLDDRIVAWKSGTVNRSVFTATAAESIAKTLVSYNAGAAATVANGRLREGAVSGLTVEADGAGGNVLDWACFGDNLLDSLQQLAMVGGGDFDVVKSGPTAFEFRWFAGQLGTDRSGSVKFSLELGNMGDPSYSVNHTNEKTVAIVGGQDSGTARVFVVRTGAGFSASNDVEVLVNATDIATVAGLQARGDRVLWQQRAVERFTFDVLQTPGCLYGRDYFLGDLVLSKNPFDGSTLTQQVRGVVLGMQAGGGESVRVVLEAR